MLKTKLIEKLKTLEGNGKKLAVKWDAGGDQTVLNFYLDKDVLPYYEDEVLEPLRTYLIEEFDLPNAGEYYNEGKGIFSIENEHQIAMVYDEFAYGEKYDKDFESEESIVEFSIPSTESCQKILDVSNKTTLNFYGSTSFLYEVSDHFEVYANPLKDKNKQAILDLQQTIKQNALSKFEPPFEGSEIGYAGTIDANQITVEELYQIKYWIDKDNKSAKKFLFE